mgnify:CR=1 FL=1
MFPLNFPENQIPDLSFLDCFHGKCVKQIPGEVALSYPCDKKHNNCHVKKKTFESKNNYCVCSSDSSYGKSFVRRLFLQILNQTNTLIVFK